MHPIELDRSALPISFLLGMALSFDALKEEIDADRPVLAGINPTSFFAQPYQAQHAVVIVGYDDNGQTIFVNDPFPYELFRAFPYERLGGILVEPGQYKISYQVFRSRLWWTTSLYDVADPN